MTQADTFATLGVAKGAVQIIKAAATINTSQVSTPPPTMTPQRQCLGRTRLHQIGARPAVLEGLQNEATQAGAIHHVEKGHSKRDSSEKELLTLARVDMESCQEQLQQTPSGI